MNKNFRKKINKESKEKFEVEMGEDTTKYGEFVSSYFAWLPQQKQKEKAKQMEDMTKTEK